MPPAHTQPIDRAALRKRLALLACATLAWSGCMGYRLVDLQVYRASEMRGLARKQQEQVITLDARRGLLYDRTGRELAMSIEVDSVYAVPAEIEDPSRTAAALVQALGMERSVAPTLAAKLTGDKLFVWVRRKIDPKQRAAVERLGMKGIAFAREHKRFYPHGERAAHVLGWVGMDNKGMDGLELALDGKVRGQNGQVFALRDARGKKFLKITRREPVPGDNVVLTLDETIQYIAERELRQAMRDTGAATGSVIVMDPRNGDILALANEPTYNPNRPGESDPESRKDRSIVDAYEPGSTFKVVTMAAALERNLLRTTELFDCQNGSIRIGRATIRDHKPFGVLSASQVLEQSSNVGAIKIGLRLKEADFYETMRRFGFGARTGIELPGEARGLVREPKEWSGVSQATLSFGQEISVTPLQLATAISAVANGGLLQPPRIVLRQVDAAGADGQAASDIAPRPSRRILGEPTVRDLRKMMMAVVDEGTAKAARMPGFGVAGKTGTAQKIGPEGTYEANRFVASFVGFVPSSRPALTILVVLDEPRGSLYHGGDIAAPVFRRIALPALRYLGVPPEPGRFVEEGDEPTLQAATHARRWVEPIPLDEKELLAQQMRKQKEEFQAALRRRREMRDRQGAKEKEEEPVVPARKPLPSPGSMVSGDEVMLPDLQGQTLRAAVGYLSRVGLSARLAPSGEDAPGDDGVVVEQQPAAGELIARGAEVSVRMGRFLPPAPEPAELDEPETAPEGSIAAKDEIREVKSERPRTTRLAPAARPASRARVVPARRATH